MPHVDFLTYECESRHYHQLGVSVRQRSFGRIEQIEQLKGGRSYNEITNGLAWPDKAYIIGLKFFLCADPGPAAHAQILITPKYRSV